MRIRFVLLWGYVNKKRNAPKDYKSNPCHGEKVLLIAASVEGSMLRVLEQLTEVGS